MIFFVLILLLIIFSSAKAEKSNEFNRDYISKDSSNVIKGIFVILIFLSHSRGYFELSGPYDSAYLAFQNHIKQMVVVMFLFYSGYGMMEQIKKREFTYIKSIPQKRFLNLLINYDIAILMFAAIYLWLGKELTIKKLLLSFIAWESIGNSNWYIFIIFALYIFTFISFFPIKWFGKRWHQAIYLLALTAFSLLFIYLMKYTFEKETRWYNTVLCYVLGFWYSFFKEQIEKIMMKNDIIYLIAMAGMTLAYVFTFLRRDDRLLYYILWSFAFTIITVFITMKVRIESNILSWFGEHIFSVYILQRIPMTILREFGVADRHKYIFLIVSFVLTCAMALVFDYLTGLLSKAIWKPKKQGIAA